MTVKELIAELQKHDPEARVVVEGFEYGYSDVFAVIDMEIELEGNGTEGWWYGLHRDADRGWIEGQVVSAVCLPRVDAVDNARRLKEAAERSGGES